MKLIGLGLGIGALLLLAACSGGDAERVLVLDGRSISEGEFRTQLREADFSDPDIAIVCTLLKGSMPGDIAELIMDMTPDENIIWLQEAPIDDRVRALSIIKEECARIN